MNGTCAIIGKAPIIYGAGMDFGLWGLKWNGFIWREPDMHETFWTLLRDAAHWEFELFLMLVFDGLVIGIFWPILRKHWQHHIARDRADEVYRRDGGVQ